MPGDFRRFLNKQKARAAFRHMDDNDSGRVGQSEVLAAVVQIFRCAPPAAAPLTPLHLPSNAVPVATQHSGSPFQQSPPCSAFRAHADGASQKQRRRSNTIPWSTERRGQTEHPACTRARHLLQDVMACTPAARISASPARMKRPPCLQL